MRVTITRFRQGDFWHEPVREGQVLDLPDEVGQYLIDVGSAAPEAPAEEPKPAKPAKGKAA